MKTSSVYQSSDNNKKQKIYSLTNVSPFLLLLVPVFIMILLTLTTGNTNNQGEEVVLKSSVTTKAALVNISNSFSK